MKKYDRINSYNKKYTNELEDCIKSMLPKIIDAFASIYGEEHRAYITSTLNSLKFIYYIPEKYLKTFSISDFYIRDRDFYLINYYLEYLNYLNRQSLSIKDEDLFDYIIAKYITKSDLSYEELKASGIVPILADDDPVFTFSDASEGICKIIVLPFFIIDLKTILHEFNHALSIDADIIYGKKIISTNVFLNVTSEEIVNDYIAELVLQEYLRIGGTIPKCLKRFKIGNNYEYNYYIVEYLFDALSPLILEGLITKRRNLLIGFIGKKNFQHLCQLIAVLYKGYDEAKYIELINLVDKIYNRVINTKEFDYEKYYQELESKGYRVRKLK